MTIHVYGLDEHLHATRSPRGFRFMPPLSSTYGGEIDCSESSSADEPKIWVEIKCPADLNHPDGEQNRCTVLLVLNDARRLREQLLWLCAHHYQLEEDDDA